MTKECDAEETLILKSFLDEKNDRSTDKLGKCKNNRKRVVMFFYMDRGKRAARDFVAGLNGSGAVISSHHCSKTYHDTAILTRVCTVQWSII